MRSCFAGRGAPGFNCWYQPAASYVGADAFKYTIRNSSGAVYGTGTVKVVVQPDKN